LDKIDIPVWLLNVSSTYRYDTIFWAPPWKEIYVNTRNRPESWEFAQELGCLLRDVYTDLGYKVIEIPKDTPENRVKFLLQKCLFK
jgi:predicted ATPase